MSSSSHDLHHKEVASLVVEAEYEAMPPFPDELLETIFCHFSGTTIGRAQAVCRKWNEILLALTKSSDMWFRRCKEEIPKYTLLQICNHPLEPQCRSGIEWKDVFARWRMFRGKRLFDGRAQLEPKKVISKDCDEIVMPQHFFTGMLTLCFTDDVVYDYNKGNIVAYDVHSEASVRKKHSTSTSFALAIQTLGMTVPVDAEGKSSFEASVEKAVLVILMEGHLEILIGLELKFSVRLSYAAMPPMSTWYDTVMVQTDTPGCLEVQAFRVQLDVGGTEQLSVDHIQTCRPKCLGALHALQLTENKALMLKGTNLIIWDIAVGEEYRSISLTSQTPEDSQKGLMSWVGSMVAVTDSNGPNIIILYYLDEECERLQNVSWVDPQEPLLAFSLLYDDSIMMSNNHQCNLLLFKIEGEDEESRSRKDIQECSPITAPSHSVEVKQDSENGIDSLVPKSRYATCDTVDEANSYKKNLSELMGIDEGDPLWKNFDTEANSSEDCRHVDTSSDSSDYDWSENENNKEGSCLTCEEYILEQWKEGSKEIELSHLARTSVIQKSILSVPIQGYKTVKWKYFFTDSSIAIDTAWDHMFQDRLFVYKWNYKQ